MKELEKRIREFGSKSNWTGLQTYMEDVEEETVINLIKQRVHSPNFESLWNYILKGFGEDDESRKKQYKVTVGCLELFEKEPNLKLDNIIARLCGTLVMYKTNRLVSLCQKCLEFIQKGNFTDSCWLKLFPQLLNILLRKDVVDYNGDEITGFEFKTQIINALTFIEWSTNIVIPLTAMFIDMPLTKDEHLTVAYKLCKCIMQLTPQELPAFVYQFLKFCKNQNGTILFFKLQNYFNVHIYSRPLPSSNSLELISDSLPEEAIQAESTVLFHIYQSTLMGRECIKEYLTFLKNLTKAPELILHPFQLTILLSVSSIAYYESNVLALIKQSIARNFYEEIKISESNWLKGTISNVVNLNITFQTVIEYSVSDRDTVLHGLVNLGFLLLNSGALLGRESPEVTKQWNLGKRILLDLVGRKNCIAHSVLQRLCKEILINTTSTQHIGLFYDFSTRYPYLMVEHKPKVIQLTESLLELPDNISEQILESIIPITKVVFSFRDQLVLLLRKGLHSRLASARQMAIKGFVKLLVNLKISSLTSLSSQHSDSQLSSSVSNYSVLTQITINCTVHDRQPSAFSDEALCLEVLQILRRCFMQPADIKSKLYEGLTGAVSQNQKIGGAVLNMLHGHFRDYYIADEETNPPLRFNKTMSVRDPDIILEEPIGKLIFAINLIMRNTLKSDCANQSAKKFIEMFNSLVSRMCKCELIHFELDDGVSLLDVLPESQKKVITLQQAMTVYEALIGYRIISWEITSENYAQDINKLFQVYFRLKRCITDKPKKMKKKKDSSNATEDQTKNETSSIHSSVNKLKNLKIPDTLLDFKTLKKFLKLLHCNEVDFTSVSQSNILKPSTEIHQHVMHSTLFLFQNLRNMKSLERHIRYYKYAKDIGKIIYKRCIERLDDFADFDLTTAVLAAECFQTILFLICNSYKKHFNAFLCDISEQEETEVLTHLQIFIKKYEELFEIDFQSTGGESDGKKLKLVIVSTLTLLVQQIPPGINYQSNHFLEWIKSYSTDHSITNKPAAATFINLWFSNHIKNKLSFTIFEEIVDNLRLVFGSSKEDKTGVQTFAIINEGTAHTFIEKLSITIKAILTDANCVINRLKSEHSVIKYFEGEDFAKKIELLRNREKELCCYLCFIITLLEGVCSILLPIGNLTEAILKNIIDLYVCLKNLAKHFITTSSKDNPIFQRVRFDRVVKLTGQHLSPTINNFILYIEENQNEETNSETKTKRKKTNDMLKNKILRETKSIPMVVYESELFSKLVAQLSKKTKVDIFKYIGVGTTRDFRIKDINNVLKKNADGDSSMERSVSDESVQEETEDNEENEDESHDESDRPPSKKSKK